MTRGVPTPGLLPRPGSLRERVKAMVDRGLTAADIRTELDAAGVNPNTIDSYLGVFLPPESMWADHAHKACDLHLADLRREHGGARA